LHAVVSSQQLPLKKENKIKKRCLNLQKHAIWLLFYDLLVYF